MKSSWASNNTPQDVMKKEIPGYLQIKMTDAGYEHQPYIC